VPRWTLEFAVVLVVVAATAMAQSRWYVTPTFTTFLVLLLLISADLGHAGRGASASGWPRPR
jgi:hypothetical protein